MGKALKILILVIIIILVLIGIFILVGYLESGKNFARFASVFRADERVEKSIVSDIHFDEIEIKTAIDNVDITIATDNRLTVKYYDSIKKPYTYDISNNKFVFEYEDNRWTNLFGLRSKDKTIEIALPEKVYKSLNISSASGNTEINGIKSEASNFAYASGDINIKNSELGATNIALASGNIILSGCVFGDLDINSASGDVNIDKCELGDIDFDKASGSITIEESVVNIIDGDSASGNLKISDSEINGIDMKLVSGSATFILKESFAYYNYDLKAISGEISIDYDALKNTSLKEYKGGEGSIKIKLHVVSGNVSISFH